jgi:hypothetical protein
MKFENKIVGFYSIHPIKISIKKNQLLGGYSFLTMTHPDHKKRGVFTNLAMKTYDEAKKRDYQFIIGFANDNSFPGFVKRLGFKEITKINLIRIKSKNASEICKIKFNKYPKQIPGLWKNFELKDNYPIKIERTMKFLNWRFVKNPIFKYYICYKRNNYLFIYKKYGNTFHIIDFMLTDKKYYGVLIDSAIKKADELKCKEITLWSPKKFSSIIKINQKNFQEEIGNSHFIVKTFNKKYLNLMEDINNWYFTMADADMF